MSNVTHNITDTELRGKLEKSYIDPNQKKELVPLISEMTDQERLELIALINQSNEEAIQANEKYEKRVGEINKEYEGKINNLVKETTENAYKEAEKAETNKEAEVLNAVEGEIISAENSAQVTKTAKHKGHALHNLFLIILILLIIGGGALYALQMLSNIK